MTHPPKLATAVGYLGVTERVDGTTVDGSSGVGDGLGPVVSLQAAIRATPAANM
jgi:hypothetical protein